MSEALALHPDVLSLSEFFVALWPFTFDENTTWSGHQFALELGTPRPAVTYLLQRRLEPPEFLYPIDEPTSRYDRDRGVAPLVATALPFLLGSGAPAATIDAVAEEILDDVRSWCPSPAADQFRRLFAALAARFGTRYLVERSGGSGNWATEMSRCFPEARFVVLWRNGPDTARSMARHPAFRLALVRWQIEHATGLDPLTVDLDREQLAGVPTFAREAWGRDDALMSADIPIEAFARSWSRTTFEMTRWLRSRSADTLVVHYEALCAEPVATLGRVAAFLELPGSETWARAAASLVRCTTPAQPDSAPSLERDCRLGEQALASSIAALNVAGSV